MCVRNRRCFLKWGVSTNVMMQSFALMLMVVNEAKVETIVAFQHHQERYEWLPRLCSLSPSTVSVQNSAVPWHPCRKKKNSVTSTFARPPPTQEEEKFAGSERFKCESGKQSCSGRTFCEEHQKRTFGQLATDENSDAHSTRRQILSIAVPALAGLAIDPLMTLADTVFVGRAATSSAALAGVGSAAALLTFSFYIFNFLATATTPLVATMRASQNENGAAAVGGQALSLALIVGTFLTIVLTMLSPQLLGIMGSMSAGHEAYGFAMSFFAVRALAAPAVLVCSAAIGVLRGYLDTKTPFVILLVANVINFALDVILIPGMGMGPMGAAIATTTAEWIAALSFLGVLAGNLPSADGELGSNQRIMDGVEGSEHGNFAKLRVVPSRSIPPWREVKGLFVASSSVFLRTVILQLALAGAAAAAARSTTETLISLDGDSLTSSPSLAAHQIALQLWLLCSFVCDSLAVASQALIADGLGRDDPNAIRDVSWAALSYSLGLGVLLSALIGWGEATHFLLDFFTSDAATQAALSPLLLIVVLSQPLNAMVFTADGILQGASEFAYQARSMALSVALGVLSFVGIEKIVGLSDEMGRLVHVWEALVVLQLMRLITSLVKIVDAKGPVKLLQGKTSRSVE